MVSRPTGGERCSLIGQISTNQRASLFPENFSHLPPQRSEHCSSLLQDATTNQLLKSLKGETKLGFHQPLPHFDEQAKNMTLCNELASLEFAKGVKGKRV